MYAPSIASWVLPRAARQRAMPSSISSCDTGSLCSSNATSQFISNGHQHSCISSNQRYFSFERTIYPVLGTSSQHVLLPISLDKYPVLGTSFWLCQCKLQADHGDLATKGTRTSSLC